MALVNVLTGGTASADSTLTTYVAANACDGSTATLWNSASSAWPHWWQYQFPVPRVITKLRMYPVGDASGYYVRNFYFQGSQDGVNWTTLLWSQMANAAGWQDFTFPNQTAYFYYRIHVVDTYRTDSRYACIAEVEMHEDDDEVPFMLSLRRSRANPKMVSMPYDIPAVFLTKENPSIAPAGTPAADVISADSIYSGSYPASAACDGVDGTYWNSANTSMPHYWQYQFAAGRFIVKIRITPYSDGGGAYAKDFTVQGSTDGSAWTTLLTDQLPNDGLGHSYDMAPSIAYTYYRVNFSTAWHTGNYTVIKEIALLQANTLNPITHKHRVRETRPVSGNLSVPNFNNIIAPPLQILPASESVTLPQNLGWDGSKQDKGYVMVRFDDENIGQYTYALPHMRAHHIPGTCYVSAGNMLYGVKNYGYSILSWAQLGEMQGEGWIVGNHCEWEEPMTGAALAYQIYFLQRCGSQLVNRGFKYGLTHVAMPGGEGYFDANTITAMTYLGVQTGVTYRSTWEEFCPPTISNLRIGCSGNNFLITTTTTYNDIKAIIDTCIANKNFTQLVFHEIAATPTVGFTYSTTPTIFDQVIDYLVDRALAGVLQCVNVDEFLRCQSGAISGRLAIA